MHPPRRHAAGFTLIEMLLVVAIISLLISILLPAFSNAKELARISVCASNEHQLHTAISEYSATNQRRFPYDTDTGNGPWMWDMTLDSTTDLIASAGGKVDIFFCPSNSEQNTNIHWAFTGNYRVLGYFFMFKRASGPLATFPLAGGKQLVRSLSEVYDHATQELVADANLSTQSNPPNFADVVGGSPIHHRSAHLHPKTLQPTGGNVLFLDGHVIWRPFADMALRYWGPNHWY